MLAKFKKIKIYILLIVLLIPVDDLVGQTRFSVGISAGYATFKMKSLADYQQERLGQYDTPVKITDNFPGYLNYSANFMISRPSIFYAFYLGHTSTGGRIHYSDYSGEVSSKMFAKMTFLGAGIAAQIFQIKSTKVFLGGNLLVYLDKLKMTEHEIVYDTDRNYKSSVTLESLNLAAGPLLEAQREVKKILFKINGSYELHLPGRLTLDGAQDYYLKNSAGESVKIDGSGLRFNIGVSYLLR